MSFSVHPFAVGEKIVCVIPSKSNWFGPGVEEGKVYVVRGSMLSLSGVPAVILVGLVSYLPGIKNGYYFSYRFRKLADLKQEASQLTRQQVEVGR